jgi:hypothetical protein
MRGKKMTERGEHAAELGGLGVLAAPAVHSMATKGREAFKAGGGFRGAAKAAWQGIKHASVVDGALSLFKKESQGITNVMTSHGVQGTQGMGQSGEAYARFHAAQAAQKAAKPLAVAKPLAKGIVSSRGAAPVMNAARKVQPGWFSNVAAKLGQHLH